MHTSTVAPYPVRIDVEPTARFARVQLLLQLLVFGAFGVVHQSAGGLFGLLYLFLPLAAAILVSHRSGAGYLARDASFIAGVLEWVLGLYAYLLFVTDTFPLSQQDRVLRLRIEPRGTPTVSSAILRLVATLPQALALMLIGLAASVVGCIAAVAVLFNETYPAVLREFQREVIGWLARVLAYHASLVDVYPPFSFETSPPSGAHADPVAGTR